MKSPHSTSSRFIVDRYLDLLLEEGARPRDSRPDVARAVVEAMGQMPSRPRRNRTRMWLHVACALLGIGVVASVALWQPSTPRSTRKEMPQDALGDPVTVRSIDEIRALPVDASNVRLQLYTADAVRALTRLRHLRRLDVSFPLGRYWKPHQPVRPPFFPAAFEPLGQLVSLESLDLSGHGAISELESLTTLSRLRTLRISNALIDAPSLAALKSFTNLEDLEMLSSFAIDPSGDPILDLRSVDYGLVSIARLHSLRRLAISNCRADAAGLQALAGLPHLTELNLGPVGDWLEPSGPRKQLSPRVYEPLAKLSTLFSLTLNSWLDAKAIEAFGDHDGLRVLALNSVGGLAGEAVGRALAGIPKLRRLEVSGTDIDLPAVRALGQSNSLAEILIDCGRPVLDEAFAGLAALPTLRRVDLVLGTDNCLAIFESTPLTHVGIRYSVDLTTAGVLRLPRTLRSLDANEQHLTRDLFARLPNLRILSIGLGDDVDAAHPMIEQLYDSPIRESLVELTLRRGSTRVPELELLAEFPALRRLDLREASDVASESLIDRLERVGVVVQRRSEPPLLELPAPEPPGETMTISQK